ncbi:MAG: hypothetical protein QXW97_02040 [Candidatus Pacearchaeota archaeon]
MATKTDKQIIRRKKFITVELPIINFKVELIGNSTKDIIGRTIKLDLTRQLKGKSVEMTFKTKLENDKVIGVPFKIKLLSYFIRRMIRRRISYVEDSFNVQSRESLLKIKPFLITKRKVSRRIRKTLRNRAKNWIIDYISERSDYEIFNDIISNKVQKMLSLYLKKTYPLSLCEIRILEIVRSLSPEEISKIEVSKKIDKKIKDQDAEYEIDNKGFDKEEIENKEIKEAQSVISETQKKAIEIQENNHDKKIKKTTKKLKKRES